MAETAARPARARSPRTPAANPPGPRRAVVVGGNRIPFARAGERVGEVVGGAVLKHSRDFNLTREAVLGSALAPDTPAHDLQMACATGIEAVVGIANKIRLGQIEAEST